ncbi:hypothetical protein IT417_01055 [bacterium]|nr:hypothetical protein [bacterium]
MLELFVPNTKNHYKPLLLRNSALLVYTVFIFLVNTYGGVFGISQVEASSITPNNVISLTNKERTKYGLSGLKSNSQLASAALAKANNMLSVQYWNHFGPNGETPWQFIKAAGYTYIYAGENLAKGFKSSEGVVEAWMASPTHRDNILSGNYRDIGVAVVNGQLLGDEVTLVVQMFGNQTNSVVPSPKPNVNGSQTESGQTLSIKITSPENNTILNDANVNLKGTVSKSTPYTVEISEKGVPVGAFESNDTNWEWDKQSDWSEGKHTVTVKLKNVKEASDSVVFRIDSTSPVLERFEAVSKGLDWKISGKVDDSNSTINIVSGDFNKSAVINESGEFTAEIPGSELKEKVTLIVSDTMGNTNEVDVTDYFTTENETTALGAIWNAVNNLYSKSTINGVFLGFILLLLIIEIITYWRKGLLMKHGGNIFTLGFWWLLLLVGVVNGFNGSIN